MKGIILPIITLFILNILCIEAQNSPQNNSKHTSFGSSKKEIGARSPNKGIIYNTEINDDNLNVRAIPSIKGKKLRKLNKGDKIRIVGISREKYFIDNFNGHWFQISLDGEYSHGWVFSKYVNFDQFFTSEIEISGMESNQWGDIKLLASYMLGDTQKNLKISAKKVDNKDCYVFTFDFSNYGYHYSNIPGCYLWYPETKELKHITYLGGEASAWGASMWAYLTDDFKYLMQDFGTGPPPRNLKVWRLSDGELAFDGAYNNINLQKNTIDKVYSYKSYYDGKWSEENTKLNEDQLQSARKYLKENPPPKEMLEKTHSSGTGVDVTLVCEYNLITKEEKIKRVKYTRVQ